MDSDTRNTKTYPQFLLRNPLGTIFLHADYNTWNIQTNWYTEVIVHMI